MFHYERVRRRWLSHPFSGSNRLADPNQIQDALIPTLSRLEPPPRQTKGGTRLYRDSLLSFSDIGLLKSYN